LNRSFQKKKNFEQRESNCPLRLWLLQQQQASSSSAAAFQDSGKEQTRFSCPFVFLAGTKWRRGACCSAVVSKIPYCPCSKISFVFSTGDIFLLFSF
jgi:hypothetical protein